MDRSTYFIDKSSQTFADNLAAFGLAFVLDMIVEGRAEVRLEDAGSAFAVVVEPELRQEWVKAAWFQAGAPFLVTVDSKTKQKVLKGTSFAVADLPIGSEVVVDYADEKEQVNRFHEWRKSLTKEERKAWIKGMLNSPVTPHPDWDLFRAVNPASLQAYNGLVGEWWRGRGAFAEMLGILLEMTKQTPNDISGAEKAWEMLCKKNGWEVTRRVSTSQLFNPSQGKGTNAVKAVWASPNNLKSFWLLEWLKLAGIRAAGFTRLIGGSKKKDRKTYVLSPMRLGWMDHQIIMGEFRRRMVGSAGAIQLDVLAALRYTQCLIDHYEAARSQDLVAEFLGRRASDLVQGMQMAFYKDLGSAIATMNIASINLPGWVRPQNAEDFQTFKAALAEHELIVRLLDESRSDQYDLLKFYRDFLSGNDLWPFFRFATAYSSFLMHQYEKRQFVRPFTTTTLEVLFMNSDDTHKRFSQIVLDPGFKNIAYAIRHSTVIPQGRKAKGNRPDVDIRYGLGQDLARKAAYPQDFLAAIAEFIHVYNAENAQLRESKRKVYRKNVTTADIDALTCLVDEFGSKLVCNMLIAYGYAREPYEKGEEETPEASLVNRQDDEEVIEISENDDQDEEQHSDD